MKRSIFYVLLAAATFTCAGCINKDHITAFAPQRGSVCGQVKITGTIYPFGTLDGVWFNGTKAAASVRPDPSANGTYFIQATVPPGATSGPIRASISSTGLASLFDQGTDQTLTPPFEIVGSPSEPQITSFSASPQAISPGGSTTLSWSVSGTTTGLTLNGVDVAGSNSKTEQPSSSTIYTLAARNSCLTPVSKTVDVKVSYQTGAFVKVPTTTIPPTAGAHGTNGSSCSANVIAGGLSPLYAVIQCGTVKHPEIPLEGEDHYNQSGIGFYGQSLGVVASRSNAISGASQVTYTPVLTSDVSKVLPGEAVLDTIPPSATGQFPGPQFFASPDGFLVITNGFGTDATQFGPQALEIYNVYNTNNSFTKIYYSSAFSAAVISYGSGQAVKVVADGETYGPYQIF